MSCWACVPSSKQSLAARCMYTGQSFASHCTEYRQPGNVCVTRRRMNKRKSTWERRQDRRGGKNNNNTPTSERCSGDGCFRRTRDKCNGRLPHMLYSSTGSKVTPKPGEGVLGGRENACSVVAPNRCTKPPGKNAPQQEQAAPAAAEALIYPYKAGYTHVHVQTQTHKYTEENDKREAAEVATVGLDVLCIICVVALISFPSAIATARCAAARTRRRRYRR
eukprot:scpid4932/ scgid16269/ 